ncbi:MAG: hypothetical protein U7M05_12420 [Candidatus Igneacidithiobacillus chanchocoensis]
MNAFKNFEIAVDALCNGAICKNVRAEVEKIAAQIRAKGADWIAARVIELHITDAEVSEYAEFPIEDNYRFYLERWQLALIK